MFDVAQSKAISATADMFVSILENAQLRKVDQQIFKIEKNRHSGMIGVGIIGEIIRKKYRVNAVAIREREDQINATLAGEQPDDNINRSDENEKLRNNKVGEKYSGHYGEKKYNRLEKPERTA
jgi:hypothetical protein